MKGKKFKRRFKVRGRLGKKKKNEEEINRELWQDSGRVENIKNMKRIYQMLEDDVTVKNDMVHDLTTYMTIWHDNIDVPENVEPCRKPYACRIRIPIWEKLGKNQVFLWRLI